MTWTVDLGNVITAEQKAERARKALVPQIISDRQFFQEVANRGLITEEEALEAVGSGTIPAAMVSLIESLPEEKRFPARMMVRGATQFNRDNEISVLIGSLFGWSEEQIDDLWIQAATL